MGEFVIYRRADGLVDWRLEAANGEIVATSGGQGFRDKADAERAIGDLMGLVIESLSARVMLENVEIRDALGE